MSDATTAEVAKRAGAARSTIQDWVEAGMLQPSRTRAGVASHWSPREAYLARVAAAIRARGFSRPRAASILAAVRAHVEPFRGEFLVAVVRGDERDCEARLCDELSAVLLAANGWTVITQLFEGDNGG